MDGRTNKTYRTENVGRKVHCLIDGWFAGYIPKDVLCKLVQRGFNFEKALKEAKKNE